MVRTVPTLPDAKAQAYLNLAIINLGEALAELGNVRQRNKPPGMDYANVKLALMRAMCALDGVPFVPPENQISAFPAVQVITGPAEGIAGKMSDAKD